MLRRPVESGQFTSLRWGERLAELGAVASVGSVGDSYDNTQRLHSHLGDTPPAEFEEAYAARQADHALVGNNKPSLHKTQCDSHLASQPDPLS